MTENLRWVRSTISQAGFGVGEEKLVDISNETIEGFIQTGVLVLLDDAFLTLSNDAGVIEEPEYLPVEEPVEVLPDAELPEPGLVEVFPGDENPDWAGEEATDG